MTNDLKELENDWSLAVGLALRNERHKWSGVQEQLAYESGVAIKTLQRIETGRSNLTLHTLVRLCHTLQITPAAVICTADELVRRPDKLRAELELTVGGSQSRDESIAPS